MTRSSPHGPLASAPYPCLIARTMAFSIVISEGLLLWHWGKAGIGVTLLLTLMLTFIAGCDLVQRWGRRKGKTFTLLRYGFIFSAIGLLFILLMLHGRHGWIDLLPGIVASGIGGGMVCSLSSGRSSPVSINSAGRHAAMLLSIGATVVITLLVQRQSTPGTAGFCFAFALLADLALIGAVRVRIAERDLENEQLKPIACGLPDAAGGDKSRAL